MLHECLFFVLPFCLWELSYKIYIVLQFCGQFSHCVLGNPGDHTGLPILMDLRPEHATQKSVTFQRKNNELVGKLSRLSSVKCVFIPTNHFPFTSFPIGQNFLFFHIYSQRVIAALYFRFSFHLLFLLYFFLFCGGGQQDLVMLCATILGHHQISPFLLNLILLDSLLPSYSFPFPLFLLKNKCHMFSRISSCQFQVFSSGELGIHPCVSHVFAIETYFSPQHPFPFFLLQC